jgi:hypothetical protein
LQSRLATFPVTAPGVYALGGFQPVVVPGFNGVAVFNGFAAGIAALLLTGTAALRFRRRR